MSSFYLQFDSEAELTAWVFRGSLVDGVRTRTLSENRTRRKGIGQGPCPRIGHGGREEVCSSSHRGYPYGQREGMILTPVDVHHDTRTVPITTSTEQELTPVCPWQRTGLQGRGSCPQ